MCAPAAHARDHEDRRVKLERNSHQIKSISGGKVHVWMQALLLQHHLLENVGDIAPLRIPFAAPISLPIFVKMPARLSPFLYSRWPNPIIFFLFLSASRIHASALSGEPISISIFIASSLAPP